MFDTWDAIDIWSSITNPRSRITADVSTNWPHMLIRLIVIGVCTFGDCIIIASDLFSFKTSPLSHSHIFTSRTHSSIRSKARVCSDGGNVTYSWVSSAYRWCCMLRCCNSFANGATYALKVSVLGPTPGVPLLWWSSVATRYSSRAPRLFDYAGTKSAMRAHRHTVRSHTVVAWVCCGQLCRKPPWGLTTPDVHSVGCQWTAPRRCECVEALTRHCVAGGMRFGKLRIYRSHPWNVAAVAQRRAQLAWPQTRCWRLGGS